MIIFSFYRRACLRLLGDFSRSEDGMTLPLLAVSLLSLMALSGIAIDVGRLQMTQSKLQFSVDSAGLAAGATVSTANADTEFQKYLNVNFGCSASSPGSDCYLGSSIAGHSLTTDSTNTLIKLSATALMPTTFMKVFGVDNITLTANSQITRSITGLELVFVLDVTGSMSGAKLSALKSAAKTLVTNLFGTATTSTDGKLWVGVVPFSQAVNIGKEHTDWLNADYTYDSTSDKTAALVWGPSGSSWGGCVDARLNGYDVTDDTPSLTDEDTMFGAYYWTSDNLHTGSFSISKTNVWRYYKVCKYNYSGILTCSSAESCPSSYVSCTLENFYSPLSTTGRGPNRYCPAEVTRMTNVLSTVTSAISALTAVGNTEINEGLVWGWRMISPRWRGFWGGTMGANSLPLDYKTKGMAKAIVLLTDGENTISNGSHGSYWFLGNGRTGSTSSSGAVDKLDDKTLSVCTSIKNAGIYLYTIGLGSDVNTSLLKSCATAENYYFFSPSAGDLANVFNTIGDSLSNLRVSK